MVPVATTSEIDDLLFADSPVAIGVSGGKDSSAVAVATCEHLDAIGHSGPRILIHADLGVTEWKDSLPTCEKLAKHLGLELIVVRRQKGDMMDRWEQRWSDNVSRYRNLQCVKLILPWSTPDMRFCTSELKVAPICHDLVNRFPGQVIVNVTGIRREESSGRAKAPISKPQPKLTSKTKKTAGIDWHPIIEWTLDDVWDCLKSRGMPIHEAYTVYGLSRVSCCFCIMQNQLDMLNATTCHDNHDLYRRMVRLEIASTFAFQGNQWLGDVAPDLLASDYIFAITESKNSAVSRVEAEKWLPKHLLYTKGWPTCIPTADESYRLSDMRVAVAKAVGLDIGYTTPASIIYRYTELYEKKHGSSVPVGAA